MSWQAGSFLVLALALAGGFAWYERSRPDARIVALVATLAAFAALGRIAFAALPNVKPTTDIVLISGYALGGAPGFVVGAVAGLTSNFFFGQGPWTPWQMAAWGATGLIGAGLAILTRGRIGRIRLALVCGVVGYAFAAFQDVGDWVTYSDHSLPQLGVYVGRGTGFDFIHAGGCVAFALAFGPAMARSIERFARRLKVVWAPAAPALLAAVVLAGALATAAPVRAAGTPAGYLLSAQNADGGLGSSPGQPSSELYSGWAALGLAAAGHNPADVSSGGHSLLGYIAADAGSTDTGTLERTILVAAAAGDSPRSFGGHDLVAMLEQRIRANGSVGGQVNLTAFAILALRASGAAPPAGSVAWLARQHDRDGGFSFATAGDGSDIDDTGAALEALAAAGADPGVRAGALRFLARHENADGGFPQLPGEPSNAQSTAFAVQGLIAAGAGAARGQAYLSSLIQPDGHVRYSHASDQTPVWVTAQALMALAGKPLPLAAVPRTHSARPHSTARHAATGSSARVTARGARRSTRSGRVVLDLGGVMLEPLAGGVAVAAAVAFAPIGLG